MRRSRIIGFIVVLVVISSVVLFNINKKSDNRYEHLSYYHPDLLERYDAFYNNNPNLSIENIVTYVNLGIDTERTVSKITNPDDIRVLVNKYHELPSDYQPKDLVEINNRCNNDIHYSCSLDMQYVRFEVQEHFKLLCDDVYKQKGVVIYSIGSYRSYDYQNMLFDYAISTKGKEYANMYYAKPGQSEHNAGLAIDITLDNMNYEKIEEHPDYQWVLERLHKYGFILRYPDNKESITGYHYEPWHIRYIGKELALKVYESGLTYEEYMARS